MVKKFNFTCQMKLKETQFDRIKKNSLWQSLDGAF